MSRGAAASSWRHRGGQVRWRRDLTASVAAAWIATIAVGCPGGGGDVGPKTERSVVIDGRMDDWPSGVSLQADGHDLFVHVSLPEAVTLQASRYPLAILVDADADPGTGGGLPGVTGDQTGIGAELGVVFSPPGGRTGPGERRGEGVAALVVGPEAATAPIPLPHQALDLVFAPTFAAREFEVRLARRVAGQRELSAALAGGRVSAWLVAFDRDGRLRWTRRLGTIDLPPLASDPLRAPAEVPARPPGSLRVVSWNVLFAGPARTPEPFARVFRALDPDVVLVQEWENATATDLRAWFEAHVSKGWAALDSPGWGVAVIARGPLQRLGPARIERPPEAPPDDFRPDHAMRLAAAVVDTRVGPVAVGSIHLKCCGPAGGPQDRARIAEARVIHDVLAGALARLGKSAPAARVFGGDLNLVGSDVPLSVLRSGLAAGGGDLEAARTDVPGDRALYTWRGRASRYAPGRLDFLLYGGARAAQAFALDTDRLSDEALAAAGLEREDSAASDHLPLVLDLEPVPGRFATGTP